VEQVSRFRDGADLRVTLDAVAVDHEGCEPGKERD
jgi:hypothetical protein